VSDTHICSSNDSSSSSSSSRMHVSTVCEL
jgi:hypothetical protein